MGEGPGSDGDAALPVRFYRSLRRIRRVEEEVARVYPTDRIQSPVHLSIGQEAVSVGVCEALRSGDAVFGTYRGHALYLAKGGDLRAMIAELYGKAAGCARGKGGSMHLVHPASGLMATSAVVGTTIPQAVGYAMAIRYGRGDAIVAGFFGDGAVEEGVFWESLNFAALRRLPVLFVCENNGYAIHSRLVARQPKDNLCERARTFGVPSVRVEDQDVLAVHDAARTAAGEVRDGRGPRLLEFLTYRWKEHVGPGDDWHLGYRAIEEAEPWMRDDPVARAGERLDPALRRRIDAEVEAEVRDAFEFAEHCPFPDAAALHEHVFRGE